MSTSPGPRSRLARGLVVLLLPLLGAPVLAGGADAVRATGEPPSEVRAVRQPVAARTNADNPLAGHRWGVYTGPAEMAWAPYAGATGTTQDLLGTIALAPKAKWFGDWISDRDIGARVEEYIADATGGDEDVLVQMAVFRMVPWEGEACRRLPTEREKASYKTWIARFARAVGDARAAIIVQPDGPFALCAPGGSRVLSRLVAHATRTFAALPRTAVYVEAGSSTWNHQDPRKAVRLLTRAGVRHARGFHLNTTHYDPTGMEVRFGARVVRALAARGLPGKRFTVDTAQNGRGFTWAHHRDHHAGDFDSAPTCRSRRDRHCVTLGIPPTSDVADRRWGLAPRVRRLAARYVDAYLWAGRPWLQDQAAPFVLDRALALARTTPY